MCLREMWRPVSNCAQHNNDREQCHRTDSETGLIYDPEDPNTGTGESLCVFNDYTYMEENVSEFGRLYSWEARTGARLWFASLDGASTPSWYLGFAEDPFKLNIADIKEDQLDQHTMNYPPVEGRWRSSTGEGANDSRPMKIHCNGTVPVFLYSGQLINLL